LRKFVSDGPKASTKLRRLQVILRWS
jgi:hypothetical protein